MSLESSGLIGIPHVHRAGRQSKIGVQKRLVKNSLPRVFLLQNVATKFILGAILITAAHVAQSPPGAHVHVSRFATLGGTT